MHTKDKSVCLHGEEDELDEIIDELSQQLSKFKRFDERLPLNKIESKCVNRLYELKGREPEF